MRMFAALVPPPTALGELEDFVEPRRDADPHLRWAQVDSWHVTLAFAALVSQRGVDRLVDNLTELARHTAPIDVTLGGARAFPNPAEARVLALDAGPAEPLAHVASSTRQAFSRAGIEVDGAKFHPHLTLARMRRPIEATKWLHLLDAAPPTGWQASELLLIESHLRDTANRYEVVERFHLLG